MLDAVQMVTVSFHPIPNLYLSNLRKYPPLGQYLDLRRDGHLLHCPHPPSTPSPSPSPPPPPPPPTHHHHHSHPHHTHHQVGTTLITLPISELAFPKVTVCPPKV